jgi:hypothetical protein
MSAFDRNWSLLKEASKISSFELTFPNENRRGPLISLLGFESPGLTASLAIAEYVVEDMLRGHGR